jgi:hypothetical protein
VAAGGGAGREAFADAAIGRVVVGGGLVGVGEGVVSGVSGTEAPLCATAAPGSIAVAVRTSGGVGEGAAVAAGVAASGVGSGSCARAYPAATVKKAVARKIRHGDRMRAPFLFAEPGTP